MVFEDIIDRIIKARSEVLHANRVLSQWSSLRPGESPDANEYALLVNLIRQAGENLDLVVTHVVSRSAKAENKSESARSRLIRRPATH